MSNNKQTNKQPQPNQPEAVAPQDSKKPEVKENKNENVTAYFKLHKQVTQLFQTADGFLFTHKNDATNHAKTLKNKEVETHTR